MGLGGREGKKKCPVIERKALYCVVVRTGLCLFGAEFTRTRVELVRGKLTSFSFPCGEGRAVVQKKDERCPEQAAQSPSGSGRRAEPRAPPRPAPPCCSPEPGARS